MGDNHCRASFLLSRRFLPETPGTDFISLAKFRSLEGEKTVFPPPCQRFYLLMSKIFSANAVLSKINKER